MKAVAYMKDRRIFVGDVSIDLTNQPIQKMSINNHTIKLSDTKTVAIKFDGAKNLCYIWNNAVYKGDEETDKQVNKILNSEVVNDASNVR